MIHIVYKSLNLRKASQKYLGISFLWLLLQITSNWVAENNKHLFSHTSGGRSVKSSCGQVMIPPKILGEVPLLASSNFWGCRHSSACSCIMAILLGRIVYLYLSSTSLLGHLQLNLGNTGQCRMISLSQDP